MVVVADRFLPAPPLVSVSIVTHNNAGTLGQAIDSVLTQTHRNVEVVVTDNGSTDHTREVIAGYAGETRVRPIFGDNNDHVTRRHNAAIRTSRGEFVAILDADDYYLPTLLEKQIAVFAARPPKVGVVYTPCLRWNVVTGERWLEHDLCLEGNILHGLLTAQRTYICPVSPLIRRVCLEQYPYHEEVFWEAEALFLRIALSWEFAYVDEPLVVQREHPGNAGKAIRMGTDISMLLLDRLECEPAFPRQLRPLLDRSRARAQRNLGLWAIRIADDPTLARRALLGAITWDRRLAADGRVLAALALSLVPRGPLRIANGALDRLRRHRHLTNFKADIPDHSARDRAAGG